jgi:hypothetical protein
MTKRPISLTIIAWFLIVTAVIAVASVLMVQSNATMMAELEKTGTSLSVFRVTGIIGVLVNLAVAYGIFKAQPWSRVLYIAWGIVSLGISFMTSQVAWQIRLSVAFLVIIGFFLFSLKANEYFAARGPALKREEG